MALGEFIKSNRKRQGMTIRELSKRSEVSNSYISQLETGKNENPSINVLMKLVNPLGVTIEDLYQARTTGIVKRLLDKK